MAVIGIDELLNSPSSSSNIVSIDDLEKQVNNSTGEIRNPVSQPWNLFPTTSAMLKVSPFLAPLAPVTAAADAFRDSAVLGKTAIEQPLSDQSMTFGGRLQKNLTSGKSLGSEIADNYLPAVADRALQNGENPEDVSNRLAMIHGGMSNLFDVGGFLGTGGAEGASTLVRGGANIINKFRGVKPAPISIADTLAKLQPPQSNAIEVGASKDITPVTPPPDQSAEYQNWLQQNAQSSTPPNPLMNIPLHPAEDARAQMAQVQAQQPINLPNTQGQLGLRGFQNTPQNLIKPPELAPEPLGPVRDQGQQEFDFTKGPEPAQPVITPQDNMIQISPAIQKEIDLIARTPNGARLPAYKGLNKQQLQDLFVSRVANKPVVKTELPPEFNIAQPTMKPLQRDINEQVNPFESLLSEKDIEREKQLIADRQSVDSAPENDTYGANPTALEDLKTILSDIHLKPKDPNIIEMGAGVKPPDFELGPKGKEALQRFTEEHLPKILEDVKKTGRTVEESMKALYPEFTPEESKAIQAAMKVGNLNLRQYPEEQRQQLRTLFNGKEGKLVTKPLTHAKLVEKAKDITSYPITEGILRGGEGQLAAEKISRKMTNIARMKAVAEDKNLSSQEMMQKILQNGAITDKKISTETARATNAGQIPLEAHQEKLDALRKIVDRLKTDPKLSSAESKGLIDQLKSIDPELAKITTPAQIYKFVYRNFITSGPITLGVNLGSGLGQIAGRIPMRAMEVTLAKLRSLATKEPTTATYKEIGAMLKGMQEGLGGKQIPEHLKATTFSDKYDVNPLDTLAATIQNKTGHAALNVGSKVIGAPERVLRKSDDYVKNTIGMMEKNASLARGENIFSDQHAIDRITSAQSRLSFQDDMSALGKWVAKIRHDKYDQPTALNQGLDILTYSIQPFVHTVDRIIAGGWHLSGAGSATTGAKATLAALGKGKYAGALSKGIMHDTSAGEMMDRDVAAAMIGVPLFIWVGSQLAQGNLTGSAPSGTDAQETFSNSGKTEYSFKSGGRYIPLRVVPEALATAIQIDIAIHQGLAQAKGKGQGLMSGAFKAAMNTGYMLGTKPYLGGLNSLMSSIAQKNSEDVNAPTDAGNFINRNTLVKKVASSALVPSAVKDLGVIKDTLLNKPRVVADTAMEGIKRRAGFTSGMVPEVNTFGEPVTHQMVGKVNNDPAYTLAEKFPPQPVEKTVEGVRLSQQEYHDLKQNVGILRKLAYTAMAGNKEFNAAPDGLQQLIVEDLVKDMDKAGMVPEKIREIQSDPLYYNRRLRTLLGIQKPGGERHFPYLK